MPKELTFDLTVRFSETIESDDDFKKITTNICNAIQNECIEFGVAPEDSDIYVEWISAYHHDTKFRVKNILH